jgi:hypothetical protein
VYANDGYDQAVVGVRGERRRLCTDHILSHAKQARPLDKRDCASTRRSHPRISPKHPHSQDVTFEPANRRLVFRIYASEMTDATSGAPPSKKRSLFKRAAWQDAAKKGNEDIFSHSNEFGNIVAEENRRKEEAKRKMQDEAKRKAEEEEKREQAEKQDKKGKRRKVSTDYDEPILPHDDLVDSGRIGRSQSKG